MHPPDQPARDAVREQLDETIFLEAGAGSGKTSCLVDRFVALVESGVPAERIAAITFTEKAAGELADRVRTGLQKRADGSSLIRAGIDGLDRAAICTLHAFAARVLNENPIEAGLPPRVSVLDEIGSQLRFGQRWETFLDRLLDDPSMERPLRLLLASGATPEHLRQIAVKFGENWDLVEERAGPGRTTVPAIDVTALVSEVREVVRLADACTDHSDKFLHRIEEFGTWANLLEQTVDEDALLSLLGRPPGSALGNLGSKRNWPDIEAVKDRVRALAGRAERIIASVRQACLCRIAEEIAEFTISSAEERRQAGELEFHDLLVLARSVLRDPHHGLAVRRRLARRYLRLLLDEFQDTDPIQVELAVLIASDDRDAAGKRWEDVTVEPGRLFFVGDPKQSIYRFRRADISMFLRAQRHFGSRQEELTTNFRSAEPILAWVNHTFSALITEDGESQPAYVPLDHHRPGPAVGPAVSMIGLDKHPRSWKADDIRAAEAADVAAAVSHVVSAGWTVHNPRSGTGIGSDTGNSGDTGIGTDIAGGGSGGQRPAVWSDVAILIPARTSLRALERALEAAGVPYRAETSSLVYGTGEVRDLLMVARAVEDPTDSLAVVAALRCAAFGCGDDDLYRWRHSYHGRWDHQAPPPASAPAGDVVGEGLAWLGALHRDRAWLAPSQVLERILRERRLLEVAFAHARPRDLWRRLRFVVDQCRAWEEAGGTTLRDYLDWVKLQGAEGSRVVESVLPETDDQAVRILTVHGAKGLEFPVTVLSGMSSEAGGNRSGVQVLFPPGGGWGLHIRQGLATDEFTDRQPIEEQMDRHERLRLLYVAATRACDHLIVSVHRKERNINEPTAAELLHGAGWDPQLVTALEPHTFAPTPAAAPSVARPGPALPSLADWEQQMSETMTAANRPVAVSATRLAEEAALAAEAEILAGVKKEPRDIDLPPWQKGRYGSAVGRAVHGVLQSVDLATGAGLAEECAAQAAAEGVFGREAAIEALARAALDSRLVQAAARLPHWREVYVGVPQDDRVLEGYIDLLYRDTGGLVIVDYKTDSWNDEDDLAEKVERYRVQLDAYRTAVGDATGETIAGVWLLFLRPGAARAVSVG